MIVPAVNGEGEAVSLPRPGTSRGKRLSLVDQRMRSLAKAHTNRVKRRRSHAHTSRTSGWLPSLRNAAVGLLGTIALTCAASQAVRAETRALDIYHLHTGEHEVITFKHDGAYDQDGLAKLNHILRDWRRNEVVHMDPALFDLIYEVYHETGATGPVQIVCGYRAPETNNMLRARSRGVAKFSQHTLGKAIDFYLQGVPLEKLREAGVKHEVGGVGFYPTSGSPFVHMDTGGVRDWPTRLTREQLVRLFPNGKTLHLPSDGPPLPGYQEALATYQQRHQSQGTQLASNDQQQTRGKGGNLITALFGTKSGDEEDESTPPAANVRPSVQAAPSNPQSKANQPLPAPQPLKPVLATNQPHLATRLTGQTVEPVPATDVPASSKAIVMASLPLPLERPGASTTTTPTASLTQPGSLIPLPHLQQQQRAAGAIMPTIVSGRSGASASYASLTQQTAYAKELDAPLPTDRPRSGNEQALRARAVAGAGTPDARPIDDAFSALTGTPRDTGSSTALSYAPIDSPATQHPSTTPGDAGSRVRLASLGNQDAGRSLGPTQGLTGIASNNKQSRATTAPSTKSDRADPMLRLISFVTEKLDSRLLDGGNFARSKPFAQLVHPDQRSLQQFMVKPVEVLSETFAALPDTLPSDHFSGRAVVALAVIAMQ